tara:strand:- start:942 stop:1457 length:516 start_codon:yes stop_codon:yes gene_type:complete
MSASSNLKNVLIVDDHDVVRAGLRRIISREFEGLEFEEAGDSEELFDRLKDFPADIVISDIKMPGRNGIDCLKDIKGDHPDLPVIVLTAFPESEYGARSMEAGASGFINKENVKRELPAAILLLVLCARAIAAASGDLVAERIRAECGRLLEKFLYASGRARLVSKFLEGS